MTPPSAGTAGRVTLGELYRGFFHAGARGVGGVLPWARRMVVEERRWLTAAEFTDLFSLCNFLPGPNTINLAVIVGARFRGPVGSLAALAGIFTLPVTAVLALAVLYGRVGHLAGIDAFLRGLGAAAGGLVLATGLKMAAPLLGVPRALGFLLVTFAVIAVLRWPLVPVLLTLAPLSVLAAWRRRP